MMFRRHAKAGTLTTDWLFDAIMGAIEPALVTKNAHEKTFAKNDGESPQEYSERLRSYEDAFTVLEDMLNRIERSYITKAHRKKEEMQQTMRKEEEKERTKELENIEQLFQGFQAP